MMTTRAPTSWLPDHRCSGCHSHRVQTVLDLGSVPAGDYFPPAAAPVTAEESAHPLAMMLCSRCGLAQLQDDDTSPEEPLGIEPEALRVQARDAVSQLAAAGWLASESPRTRATVAEFASPHGGSWLPLLTDRGYALADPGSPAEVVIDSFGIMHERDQRSAFAARAASVAPEGTLLLQFHSLEAIVQGHQWTALRHGHFAYYSATALSLLLAEADMNLAAAWEFPLYGGTVLVAVRHNSAKLPGDRSADASARVAEILNSERSLGVTDPAFVGELQSDASRDSDELRAWLQGLAAASTRVYAYGAASSAVALFSRAGLTQRLIAGVADGSPAKQGRRMPDTDIPVISPAELLSAQPDVVWLTLPDLLPEVESAYPELDGRWRTRCAPLAEGTGLA